MSSPVELVMVLFCSGCQYVIMILLAHDDFEDRLVFKGELYQIYRREKIYWKQRSEGI